MADGVLSMTLPIGVFLSGWLVLCLLAAVVAVGTRRRLARVEPGQRALVLLALSFAPLAIAGLVSLLVFAPAVGGLMVSAHCHTQSCAPHVPTLTGDGVVGLVAGAMIAVSTAFTLFVLGQAMLRSGLAGRTLLAVADRGAADYDVLETDQPAACSVGFFKPRTLVSRGLLDHVDRGQLRAILAHEHAHATRRDNLRNLVASLCSWLMPRPVRRTLLADLRLAAEQSCDRVAAAAVGDHVAVAQTLVRVRGVCGASRPKAGAVAFCPDATEARVRALLESDPPQRLGSWQLAALIAGPYTGLVLVGVVLVHHGVEALGTFV